MSIEAIVLHESKCILGEGPVWNPARNSFFWLDIEGKVLYQHHLKTKSVTQVKLPHRTGMIVFDHNDRLIAGMQGGLAIVDTESGAWDWLVHLEKETPDNRCNDGKCDVSGRLWVGTMNVECKEGAGAFYSVDPNLRVEKRLSNLTIPNGIAWANDNKTMYHIETSSNTVNSYMFDVGSGNIRLEKIAIKVADEFGMPDGMAIDTNGMLWIAHYNGFGVYQWNPHNGELLQKIELPVPRVTCCAFGGPDLDQLLITTAREGMTKEEVEKYPLSGSVFIATPGITGTLAYKFGKPQA